jgi:hypothetical protein
MKIRDVTENLGSLFGKGSDIGKMYNPGADPELQAKSGDPVVARPTASGAAQDDWDANYAKFYNPDGSPKNPAAGKGSGSVRYSANFKNQIRNKAIKPALMKILQSASAATGLTVEIFSGGQDVKGKGRRRTGSTRHDGGNAADVYLFDEKGNMLNTKGDDPRVVDFVAACKRAGARGLGAAPGYMNSVGIHVDLVGASQGGGVMWGAGGTGSPPQRIAQAFNTGKGTTVA